MRNAVRWWPRVKLVAAAAAGRVVGALGRGLPGVAGPLLISYGCWQAWAPLGYIVAGGFLVLLDRRVP